MLKKFYISLLILYPYSILIAQFNQYVTPVHGVAGTDFIIVNYVDWSVSGIQDAYCGSKTYDGHQGTDFVLSGFQQMDSGVNVLAADSGTVTYIHDGEFDRETTGDTSKRLGNFICIKHAGNYYGYYAHLKNGSITVSVGQHVSRGQALAQVASSGNSTDPHLHFELWYDSLINVDPFAAACGNDSTFWQAPLPYDNSFFVWRSGLMNVIPTIDTLRFHKYHQAFFNPGCDGDYISYWSLISGFRSGDSLRIQWLMPDNSLWYEYSFTNTIQDYWYYYYWSYIDELLITVPGLWKANFYHNGIKVDEKEFDIGTCDVLSVLPHRKTYTQHNDILQFYEAADQIAVYDLSGRLLLKKMNVADGSSWQLHELSPALYILKVQQSAAIYTSRIRID